MSKMSVFEAQRHAGKYIQPGWIEQNIHPIAVQAMPHYMFTEGDEKHREGWCSACGNWVELTPDRLEKTIREPEDEEYPPFVPMITNDWNFRRSFDHGRSLHNHTGYCPVCGARVTFRGMWRGHRTLEDKRFLIHYEKSGIDPQNTVVCIGYKLHAQWREMEPQGPHVPIEIRPQEICVFKPGVGGERYIWEDSWMYGAGWVHRRECRSGYAPGLFENNIQSVLDNYSFVDAIRGTPFEKPLESGSVLYSTIHGKWYDRITLMDAVAKYPCMEYLLKMEQDEIAEAILNRQIGTRINRKGTTAQQVLRLTGDEWGEVKGKGLRLTPDALDIHRYARRRKWRINMELIAWCGRRHGSFEKVKQIAEIFPGANAVKMLKYCRKHELMLHDYADQIGFMKILGMSEADTEFLYPKNFQECHQELSARVAGVKDVKANIDILNRIHSGELDEYFFSAAGFILRPAFTGSEIVAEGNALKHCVGGYVQRYKDGGTNICFLRNEDEPNTPRYTVEFSKSGVMVQCRGYGNDVGEQAMRQKRADRERLELFWKLHAMYRRDLKAMKKKEKRRKAE